MTLALHQGVPPVRSMFALADAANLDQAKEALRRREGTVAKRIGTWEKGAVEPSLIHGCAEWAEARGVDALVWTALGPRFNKKDVVPLEEEALSDLGALRGSARQLAEAYVRRTPRQIDTPLRRQFEARLGWSLLES